MIKVRPRTAFIPLCPAGHGKNILDAHADLQSLLADNKIHDYSEQKAGLEHRVKLRCVYMSRGATAETTLSLYRPKTKDGSMPRFWVYGLGKYMSPGEVLALHIFEGTVYAFNASDRDMILRTYLDSSRR